LAVKLIAKYSLESEIEHTKNQIISQSNKIIKMLFVRVSKKRRSRYQRCNYRGLIDRVGDSDEDSIEVSFDDHIFVP